MQLTIDIKFSRMDGNNPVHFTTLPTRLVWARVYIQLLNKNLGYNSDRPRVFLGLFCFRRIMRLDNRLKKEINLDNFIEIFNDLIKSKTDTYSNKILIPIGVDGIDYENIKKNLQHHGKAFCKRALSGRYLFSPFREKEIPKAPFAKNELNKAKAAGKTRTLSICTIRDTIFQTMIYNSIL